MFRGDGGPRPGLRGRGSGLRRAGEAQEHLVQGRAAQRYVLDDDAGLVERADQAGPAPFTPRLLALTGHALAAVDGLGLGVDTMMAVFGTVNAYMRGAVAAEVAERDVMRSHGYASRDDLRDAYLPQVRRVVQSGRYPTLVRYILDGSNTDDPEWQFEFGLACVLDGIAARLGI